jgi:hypothetical protein
MLISVRSYPFLRYIRVHLLTWRQETANNSFASDSVHKFTPQLFVPELVPHSCPICWINLDDGAIWVGGSFPVIFKMTNIVALCNLSSQPASCVILFVWYRKQVKKGSLFLFSSLSLLLYWGKMFRFFRAFRTAIRICDFWSSGFRRSLKQCCGSGSVGWS